MIQSIFIISTSGETLITKHYRGLLPRSVCDLFLEEVARAGTPDAVLPILTAQKYQLINIHRDSIFYLAVVSHEEPPLLVLEFLQRVAEVFRQYFGTSNESAIRDNFATVYQILDEMMDNGIPFTTEPNALMEMIPPPTMLNKMKGGLTGSSSMSSAVPDGSLSNTPWRKAGVKYANNEIYFDIVEELNATVEPNGIPSSIEVSGEIQSTCKLSGMPDLTLTFTNPHILDDVSFHPCVRHARYEQSKVLSFVPPDGQFKLMNYRVKGQLQLPIGISPRINFTNGQFKVNVSVICKVGGKSLEDVVITIPFPKNSTSNNLSANVGTVQFNDMTKVCKWSVPRFPKDKTPTLEGSVSIDSNKQPDSMPTLNVEFMMNTWSASGLKVDSLSLTNEKYKPYKGVRAITKGGKFHVRC